MDPVLGAGVAPDVVPGQHLLGLAEMVPKKSEESSAIVGERLEQTLGNRMGGQC